MRPDSYYDSKLLITQINYGSDVIQLLFQFAQFPRENISISGINTTHCIVKGCQGNSYQVYWWYKPFQTTYWMYPATTRSHTSVDVAWQCSMFYSGKQKQTCERRVHTNNKNETARV